MPPGRRRSHAWLARTKGNSDVPFLPWRGQLYLVNSLAYVGSDPAAERPAVVIADVPDEASHRPIQIVTRTSQHARGVAHPADPSLKCDKDGVFSHLTSVERLLWTPSNVELLGDLPAPYLTAVMRRFG